VSVAACTRILADASEPGGARITAVPDSDDFPIGAGVRLEQLQDDPHPPLARLREHEPVAWLPVLGGWLVTRHDLALAVMRNPGSFTVDDPRFSTAQVIGQSMLSLDGEAHARHREPFVAPFRPEAVRREFVAACAEETDRLLAALAPAGEMELRRSFAGPLAAQVVTRMLGFERSEVGQVLAWYDAIVAAVTEITAGGRLATAAQEAFAALGARLERVIERVDSWLLPAADSGLTHAQIVSNVAVLLFGGIETTEGMIANAALTVLENPAGIPRIRDDPRLLEAAIDESLRLEPAAAMIDRYAVTDVELGGAQIAAGDLVRVSITAANRDPAVFTQPDEFRLERPHPRRHLAFAHGPHVCLGVHLARLEARTALGRLLDRLPNLRLDPARPSAARGLVFRKPATLHVVWDGPARQTPR
jgi:cytochrome P450